MKALMEFKEACGNVVTNVGEMVGFFLASIFVPTTVIVAIVLLLKLIF